MFYNIIISFSIVLLFLHLMEVQRSVYCNIVALLLKSIYSKCYFVKILIVFDYFGAIIKI